MGAALLTASCAATTPSRLDHAIEADGARIMWVGAHPDDEALAGPVLARACLGLERRCLLLVLNRGDGGECLLPEGCFPDVGTVRARELKKVAEAFGAELLHYRFWNAPLPWESFPPREEIARRWRAQGDPAQLIAAAIRRFRPTVLLTFEPHNGFTGHPEHQLASRFAMVGARLATRPGDGGEAHRVSDVFQLLNRYWITRLAGSADPTEENELFDTHQSCGAPRRTALDVALEITKHHRTQARDMGTVRALRPQMGFVYLRRVDPYEAPVEAGLDGEWEPKEPGR